MKHTYEITFRIDVNESIQATDNFSLHVRNKLINDNFHYIKPIKLEEFTPTYTFLQIIAEIQKSYYNSFPVRIARQCWHDKTWYLQINAKFEIDEKRSTFNTYIPPDFNDNDWYIVGTCYDI